MNVESKFFKIESAPGGCGFDLTKKAGAHGPAWVRHISEAPAVGYLAAISESQFDCEAAEAWESGAWNCRG